MTFDSFRPLMCLGYSNLCRWRDLEETYFQTAEFSCVQNHRAYHRKENDKAKTEQQEPNEHQLTTRASNNRQPTMSTGHSTAGGKRNNELGYLDWRLDPEDSLSDWTIQIVPDDSGPSSPSVSKTYHVHICVLGGGAMRCGYFTCLFKNKDSFSEGKTRTSVIHLHSTAADVFPAFLDYLYGSPKFGFSNENILALHLMKLKGDGIGKEISRNR
jgi:BTB/POZ domain